MAGWHHQLDGHEFEWTPGVGDGQGGLACCNSWGRRVGHDWATELNWTELNWKAKCNSKTWVYPGLGKERSVSTPVPPLTSDVTICCCCCCVASVISHSLRPHRWQPIRLPRPWDSPGKNTEGGCHFLLQCMKVKSESEVAQSCPTLSNPMVCSLPGSIHGIFQARVLEWGAIAFSVYSFYHPLLGYLSCYILYTLYIRNNIVTNNLVRTLWALVKKRF